MKIISFFPFVIVLFFAGCISSAQVAAIPTLAQLPSETPTATFTPTDTATMTNTFTPSVTFTPSATATPDVLKTQIAQGNLTNEAAQNTLAALWTQMAPTLTFTLTSIPTTTFTPSLTITNTITPTQSPEPLIAMRPQLFYAQGSVNLRSCARRSCTLVAQLDGGSAIMATGKINGEAVKSGNALWYQVDHQGERGFIYADYVSSSPPTITPLPPPPTIPPPRYYGPSIVCADGTISYAESSQGACSHHGGIMGNNVPSVPDNSPSIPDYPTSSYSGGGTMCRDGTFSTSTGRGTCSHHGGIAR